MFSLKLIKGICSLNEPAFVLVPWYVQQVGQDRPKQTEASPPLGHTLECWEKSAHVRLDLKKTQCCLQFLLETLSIRKGNWY